VIRRTVFITGGTGFIGRHLIPRLLERSHQVRALVRPGSESKLPAGCVAVPGNPLEGKTFLPQIKPADTFIHLVGVTHPTPARAHEFRVVDLTSLCASVAAAADAGVRNFVYVSVAQPAPVMREYGDVRREAEAVIRSSGLNAVILRPWYVLGPGRTWPAFLKPLYWVGDRLPLVNRSSKRLGLVTIEEMTGALVRSVEEPQGGFEVLDVPAIRDAGADGQTQVTR
jgi:uncharacterized protein YbjT (DUF2867 family)